MTDTSIDISSFLKKNTDWIERHLAKLVPETQDPYGRLFVAARHSLLDGGKRLRPLLVMAAAETFGIDATQALNTACAFEMVHTYSLIHDDLPCMDNDDFRRGKPTLHKVYGDGVAVLTGDFLLTYAFETIAKDSFLVPDQKTRLTALLAHNAGAHGIIGGQLMDIQAENCTPDIAELQKIHCLKTGALITAAIMAGGIIGTAADSEMAALETFGRCVGLAFQIIDDVLDVTASEEKHGKAIGSDLSNKKTTYATLLGIEASTRNAHLLYADALRALEKLNRDTSLIKCMAARLVHRSI